MGMFGFFKRRQERESAIPGGSESVTRGLKEDGAPVGQPVQGVGQPEFDLTSLAGLSGMASMMGQAIQMGNAQFQVTQGQGQVIDARGAEGLRDEILGAMRKHGIDPDDPANSQVDASAMPALQAEIMQALQNAGIDPGAGSSGDAGAAG